MNPWTGSAVNANVAKIILERELDMKVQLVEIDEYAQFPALASGDLDASLEVWPSGHAADIGRYIEGRRGGPLRDGGVVDGGRLGVVGNIGWWIPTYMLDRHPQLASYRGIKGDEQLFSTAKSSSAAVARVRPPLTSSTAVSEASSTRVDAARGQRARPRSTCSYWRRYAAHLFGAPVGRRQGNDPLALLFLLPHWRSRVRPHRGQGARQRARTRKYTRAPLRPATSGVLRAGSKIPPPPPVPLELHNATRPDSSHRRRPTRARLSRSTRARAHAAPGAALDRPASRGLAAVAAAAVS